HSIVEVAPGVFDIVGYKSPPQPTSGTTNCCGACSGTTGTTGTTGVSITEIEYSNGKIIGKHRIR
ncbi:MAG: hypothetical protein QXE19_02610, partial [Candidatus Bathyarchaeia archaeon]